jgi:ribosomal protein S18 acetylase RimI-like enzyme
MSSNEIRKAQAEDTGEIMELIAKCVQAMQAGGSDQWDDSYPNREIIGRDIERGTLYTYIADEAIAGIIVLDELQNEMYREIEWSQEQGRHLIMHRLAVHPEVQGKGIARKLIAFSEEHARREGYSSIRLDTYSKNTRALALYPSLGYERRGELFFPHRSVSFPVFEKVLIVEGA